MSVKVKIPPPLRQLAGGKDVADVVGQTVGECLDNLEVQFPGIKQRLYDKQGRLLNYFGVYINSESAYPEELTKPVNDGDELTIAILIIGG